MTRKWGYSLLGGLLLTSLVGCQSIHTATSGELALKEGDFLGLWDAYNFCMVGRDLSQIQVKLTELQRAPKPMSLNESPIPVPSFLKQLSSSRSSRLAVDPRAMAASCSIHLAEVAQETQNFKAAYRVLESMATDFPEPQYAYYVTEAEQALEQLNSSFRLVSFTSRNALGQ